MAFGEQDREINGKNFRVQQLDLKTSRHTLVKLMKLLGPALEKFFTTGQGVEGAIAGFSQLLQGISPDELDAFFATFAKATQVQMNNDAGTWVPYTEAVFGNNVAMQFKWFVFALEVSYKEHFLAEFGTYLPASLAKAASL